MKKNKIIKKRDIARFFFPSLIIVFALCLLGCIVDNALGITEYLFGSSEEAGSIVTDFFLVEVQVTFIVVSLSTALSTQTKRVYWVDSFQYRLIRPKYTNFTALSSYILATLATGVFFEILDRCIRDFSGLMGVFISFILSLLFMIVLSMRMIGANFGEEAIKAELEEEVRAYKAKQKVLTHIGYESGLRIPMIRKLFQVTIQEIEEKQLDLVSENLDFLFRMGFTGESKRIYNYAKKTFQSPEIMTEIDFMFMRNVVLSNESTFFYMDCPLSFDSVLKCWGGMIDERFYAAIACWNDGRKEEARRIRKDLYTLFSQSITYRLRSYECNSDEMPEKELSAVIQLLSLFVMRRENQMGSMDQHGEPIDLGSDWAESERKMLNDEELLEDLDYLSGYVSRTLAAWSEGNCSEDLQEFIDMDPYSFYEAKKF